jgi:putative transposase
VKRSLLVEAAGGPLAVVIAGANVHDTKLLAATLDAIVVERPQPTPERPQHLCLDLGYDNLTGAAAVERHHYIAHVRRIGLEKLDLVTGEQRFPARRWVVERTFSWWCGFRRLSKDYEYELESSEALIYVAMSHLLLRRLTRGVDPLSSSAG